MLCYKLKIFFLKIRPWHNLGLCQLGGTTRWSVPDVNKWNLNHRAVAKDRRRRRHRPGKWCRDAITVYTVQRCGVATATWSHICVPCFGLISSPPSKVVGKGKEMKESALRKKNGRNATFINLHKPQPGARYIHSSWRGYFVTVIAMIAI